MTRPLRVLYAVPGHHLVPTAGPTRNALSLARAWRGVELTLAFRRVAERPADASFALLELDPDGPPPAASDDAAVRGAGVLALARYLRRLRAFVERRAGEFDVLLEKSWLFSGLLVRWAARRGLPGAVVENLVRVADPAAPPLARLRHALVRRRVARDLAGATVVAETEELKEALVAHMRLDPARVHVVGLGVDHALFRPAEQAAARAALGLDPACAIALYSGAFDRTHDLVPALAALAQAPPRAGGLELHLLGDGVRRAEYEGLAAQAAPGAVRFHGRVPHERVPLWLAACDLALAPYDVRAFPDGRVAYSTLKIPEAMACARPVASVPSGHVLRLIDPGRSGLLLANTPAAWSELWGALPARASLAAMGRAAHDAVRALTWERTAAGYERVAASLLHRSPTT